MPEAVIVDAVRTPVGRRNGWLSGLHPTRILGAAQSGLLARNGIDPGSLGQVGGGCVTQAGEQPNKVTSNAWLVAGLPWRTGCTSIHCACGTSQQAVAMVDGLIARGT